MYNTNTFLFLGLVSRYLEVFMLHGLLKLVRVRYEVVASMQALKERNKFNNSNGAVPGPDSLPVV